MAIYSIKESSFKFAHCLGLILNSNAFLAS